jgi:hypothetical protein
MVKEINSVQTDEKTKQLNAEENVKQPKIVTFPSNTAQFRRQFAQLFLNENFSEASVLANSFWEAHSDEANCLEEVKRAYEQLGESDSYLKILEQMIILDPQNRTLLKEKQDLLADPEDVVSKAVVSSHDVSMATPNFPIPDDQVIADFLNIFQGRENVYARQWHNSSGKSGYTPVTEPLSFRVVKNHLLGNFTVGQYQLDMQDCVKWIAFDIDVKKAFLDNLVDRDFSQSVFSAMRDLFSRMKNMVSRYDVSLYLESSGYKGYHVWLFPDEKISARYARSFAEMLLHKSGYIPNEISVEVFPKQTKATMLGNLIKLPLGINQVSGKRSYFLDDNFMPISDFSILANIRTTPITSILQAYQDWKKEFSHLTPGINEVEKEKEKKIVEELPDTVEQPVFNLQDHQPLQYLLSNCHALSSLVEKIEKTGEITNQERLALTHTLGNLDNGNLIVNELLDKVPNTDQEYYLKKKLTGNVSSCRKMRSYLGRIIEREKCACTFTNLLNSYPHPLLHLKSMNDKLEGKSTIDEIMLKQLIEAYMNTKKDSNEISKRLEYQEERLNKFLAEAGIDKIATSFGTFVKDEETGKFTLHF